MSIFSNSRSIQSIGLILLSILLVLGMGWVIGSGILDLMGFMVILGAILLGVFLLGQQGHRNLLLACIAGLILGWRSLHILSFRVYIYPSELLIWVGFAVYLLDTVHIKKLQPLPRLPRYAKLLAIFTLLGLVVAAMNDKPLESALDQAKSFFIFVPLIFLFQGWIKSVADIYLYVRTLVVVGFTIAGFGLLEYFVPVISGLVANLQHSPTDYEYLRFNYQSGDWIRLSPFNIWGTPVVAVALVPVVGLLYVVFLRVKGVQKWLWACMGLIIVTGIILSGYRSAWLGLLVMAIVMLFLDRKSAVVVWLSGIILILYLPARFITHFYSILAFVETRDHSILVRFTRLREGLQSILHHPLLGSGWSTRAVFNDWVYIAVALGLPALIIFIIWYSRLIQKLIGVFRRSILTFNRLDRILAGGFLLGLTGYAVSMISGAMSQVRPLMTAFWIFFCLAWRFVELIGDVEYSQER